MSDPSPLVLVIEKPVVGGRMLARHEGRVVLVSGAIPGERVTARVQRVQKGVIYAEVTAVLEASPDRRGGAIDWHCGGNAYGFIEYGRQLQLKAAVVEDVVRRIGRITLPQLPEVVPSPESGYRMRARLHAQDGRVGFYRDESHVLCSPAATGQLLPATTDWLDRVASRLGPAGLAGVIAIEVAENAAATERVCHLELTADADLPAIATLASDEALTGLTVAQAGRSACLAGASTVSDVLHVSREAPGLTLQLRRHVQAFSQGNRHLLEPLVHHVLGLVPPGPVVDLYAGVGLFGLAVAACREGPIAAVEGAPVSGADLAVNAEPFGPRVSVHRESVEAFLQRAPSVEGETVIVDPPRTGLSRDAMSGVLARRPRQLVVVSCDPATFARDAGRLVAGGYAFDGLTVFDLFPNTAHVEVVAAFSAAQPPARTPRTTP